MAEDQQCPICNQLLHVFDLGTAERYRIECRRCGDYQITHSLFNTLPKDSDLLPYLSCYTRQATESGIPVTLNTTNWEILAADHRRTSIQQKITKFVKLVADRSDYPGFSVEVSQDDFPLIDAVKNEELRHYSDYLVDLGYLRREEHLHVALTVKGWNWLLSGEAAGLPGRCFVAMSFDPQLKSSWEEGIEPALKLDCGLDPLRLDFQQHNEKICDKILAEIRLAQFLVADFTQQRPGVYFEAGFALGLGRTVIWTCKEDEIDKNHFDTRQYNHVPWTDPADLRKKLRDRVIATIPLSNQIPLPE
jgi:nucleoside 2-deoxyribosyltransferase